MTHSRCAGPRTERLSEEAVAGLEAQHAVDGSKAVHVDADQHRLPLAPGLVSKKPVAVGNEAGTPEQADQQVETSCQAAHLGLSQHVASAMGLIALAMCPSPSAESMSMR